MERINRWLSEPIYSRFTIILVIINLGAYIIIFIVNMGVLILNVLLINHSIKKSDTDTYLIYGGALDLWGTTWTPAQINNSNFGVGFRALTGSSSGNIFYIDHVRIKVYYTESESDIDEIMTVSYSSIDEIMTI